jgi:uncharacterized protein
MTVILLATIFFCTSAVSVVTGGTSLLTVPVMIQFGMEPRNAVATNMFALIFLSAGGSVPFFKTGSMPLGRLPALIALTVIGSAVGAWFLLVMPSKAMQPIIAGAMVAVAGFSLLNREAGLAAPAMSSSPTAQIGGLVATFLVGIYGGFFSGGYVVLLTAAYIVCLRMTFIEAMAVTKVLNVFSSLVATLLFAMRGMIDWKLGAILSLAAFTGALVGAVFARRMSNLWLRRVFLGAVVILAAKMLLFDVDWKSYWPPSRVISAKAETVSTISPRFASGFTAKPMARPGPQNHPPPPPSA